MAATLLLGVARWVGERIVGEEEREEAERKAKKRAGKRGLMDLEKQPQAVAG